MSNEREQRLEREVKKLEKINASLMNRVERSMAKQGSAYSLFHTAIGLESQVRVRTEELRNALINLERANDELVLACDISEHANQVKTRFFTAAGHDLLQPLHAARLSLSALEGSEEPADQRRLAAQIDHALSIIEELLKTILDLSKLEAGVIQPSLETVPLDDLFSSLMVDVEPVATAKGLSVRWRRPRLSVRSDPLMLRRVLQNLLTNAVRYTEHGGIGLFARRREDRVRIEVWDTGPGIAPTERDRIFEEFQRGSTATGTTGGFGLGLAIVQRMARALDHTIDLCSHVGQGTSFHVYAPEVMPLTKGMPSPGPAAHPYITAGSKNDTKAPYGFSRCNVIVIDNDKTVLHAMAVLLERWSCNWRQAIDLQEVRQIADAADFRPDIVLADYHLDHGTNGIDGVSILREAWGPGLPAVIITADHSRSTANVVRTANCELLRKPVKPAELRALMLHLLS